MTTFLIIAICVLSIAYSGLLFWAYRKGLNDGLKLGQGNIKVEPINPIKAAVEAVQTAKDTKETTEVDKEFSQGLMNLFGYTGEPQK